MDIIQNFNLTRPVQELCPSQVRLPRLLTSLKLQVLAIVKRTAGLARNSVETFQRCVISVRGTYRTVSDMNSNYVYYGTVVLIYIHYAHHYCGSGYCLVL